MSLLGDPKDGKIPLEYLKILVGKRRFVCTAAIVYAKQFSIEEERLPYEEGWRPAAQPITQKDIIHSIFNLIQANEHKSAEASEVGLGTVHAVQNAITSLLPSYCVIM
jgi:hypothetical protein